MTLSTDDRSLGTPASSHIYSTKNELNYRYNTVRTDLQEEAVGKLSSELVGRSPDLSVMHGAR